LYQAGDAALPFRDSHLPPTRGSRYHLPVRWHTLHTYALHACDSCLLPTARCHTYRAHFPYGRFRNLLPADTHTRATIPPHTSRAPCPVLVEHTTRSACAQHRATPPYKRKSWRRRLPPPVWAEVSAAIDMAAGGSNRQRRRNGGGVVNSGYQAWRMGRASGGWRGGIGGMINSGVDIQSVIGVGSWLGVYEPGNSPSRHRAARDTRTTSLRHTACAHALFCRFGLNTTSVPWRLPSRAATLPPAVPPYGGRRRVYRCGVTKAHLLPVRRCAARRFTRGSTRFTRHLNTAFEPLPRYHTMPYYRLLPASRALPAAGLVACGLRDCSALLPCSRFTPPPHSWTSFLPYQFGFTVILPCNSLLRCI